MSTFPRRRWLASSATALGLGALPREALAAPGPVGESEPLVFNVRDFGAIGDGRPESADRDTEAFLAALKASRINGAVVRVPMGTYILRRPLDLARQHLIGHVAGGWNPDEMVLPTLVVMHTEGPAISVGHGATVHGIAIQDCVSHDARGGLVQDAERRFTPRPPAILVQGQATITNVKIMLPYDGIVMDDATSNGRTNIENVFVISPGRDGLTITNTADLATLRNIEVWCNLGPSRGAGFRFGYNDEVHGQRLFTYGCTLGFAFGDSPRHGKGTYGTYVDCATDNCVRGWQITGDTRLNVLGGDFLNEHEGILVRGRSSSLRLIGARMQSNSAPAIHCDEAEGIIISACELGGVGNKPVPYIRFGGGPNWVHRASIVGCQFARAREPNMRIGVEIGPFVRQCAITGNVFGPGPEPKVVVRPSPEAEIIESGNVGQPIMAQG
ncbi:glycosyl hydrolase family 28-related protein [Isosphaeraceae bacterium EP7]